ncbi:MAG TPA: S8 family serine peptidase [Actinomycetota bacterium]|nr:S8 family serine peptidase [Actinomycetota bacterium]
MKRLLAAAAVVAMSASAAPAAPDPDDPGFSQQWGLKTMRVPQAWEASRGDGVIVAVVDTGVDAAHPDLKGRVLPGRDFVDDDADAADEKGHGTHVAGTIAATTGNGVGIASVSPGVKILPVRVLGADGEGDPGDVAGGIAWAVEQGARVINLSLAQDDHLPVAGDALLRDTRVDRAIRKAAEDGAVVVVAAGNDDSGGKPQTAYDATVPGVLVVGATTRGDERAAYSNYGDGLDVVAPGGGTAADPKACADPNWIVSTWWNPQTRKSDYGGGCGTSMAVAHVSGVASLLLARGYSSAGAAKRIVDTAKDIGAPGRDVQTGNGRVDAMAAVGPLTATPRPTRSASSPTAAPSATTQGGLSGAGTPTATPTPTTIEPGPASPPQAAPPAEPAGRGGPITMAVVLMLAVMAAQSRARARAGAGPPAG